MPVLEAAVAFVVSEDAAVVPLVFVSLDLVVASGFFVVEVLVVSASVCSSVVSSSEASVAAICSVSPVSGWLSVCSGILPQALVRSILIARMAAILRFMFISPYVCVC